MALERRLQHAETLIEANALALFATRSRNARLLPRCGVKISTLCPARSVKRLFQQLAIFKIHGTGSPSANTPPPDKSASAARAQIPGIKFVQVFPVIFPAIHRRGRRASETDSRPPAEARRNTPARRCRRLATTQCAGAPRSLPACAARSRYAAACSYNSCSAAAGHALLPDSSSGRGAGLRETFAHRARLPRSDLQSVSPATQGPWQRLM